MFRDQHVLLIHGLAETSAWMAALNVALLAAGYRTHAIDYPSTSGPIEALTERHVHRAITDLATAPKLHIVAHSMGAVIVRHYLNTRDIPNLGRIVMIAPGNAGSRTMTFLTSFPLYTALMGPAAVQSRDDKYSFTHTLPDKIEQDFGVIAGCVPLDPSSWLVMSEPNDGRLTVGSTKLGGMRDHTVVTASHDTILFHPITAAQTLHFLNHGKFIPAFP